VACGGRCGRRPTERWRDGFRTPLSGHKPLPSTGWAFGYSVLRTRYLKRPSSGGEALTGARVNAFETGSVSPSVINGRACATQPIALAMGRGAGRISNTFALLTGQVFDVQRENVLLACAGAMKSPGTRATPASGYPPSALTGAVYRYLDHSIKNLPLQGP